MAGDNTCVCCGEIIPEGRQYCPSCENADYEGIVTRIRAGNSGLRTAKRDYIINFCREWDKARFKLRGGRK